MENSLLFGGILESATGPGGRDGYIHMNDAIETPQDGGAGNQ